MSEAVASVKAVPIPYKALPGPKGVPILGNATQVRPEAFHQQLEAWAHEFGGKFRFRITNRHMLAITDPEAISSVLRRRPQQFVKTPRLVQVAKDMGFHGVFSANGEDWKRQRQLVMPGLDPAHLHAYLPRLVTVTDRLRAKWRKAAAQGAELDLQADALHGRRDHRPRVRPGPEHHGAGR